MGTPPKLWRRFLVGLTHHLRLRAPSWIMSFCITSFGLTIMNNPGVFALPGREALYANLVRVAPAIVWGYVCVGIGAFRLVALVVNGTFPEFPHTPAMRAAGSFLACLFWFQVVLGALRIEPHVLALPVYCTFMAMDAFSLYIAMVEVERPERRRASS